MDYEDYEKIDIPFGAFDSELVYQEINIPNGFEEATIEGNKIILKKAESEDERIRKAQLDYWRSVGGKEWHGVPVQEVIAWLEKQCKQDDYDDNIITRDDELLMVITWFSRIVQLATDMTTWNNHHVRNTQECLQEITLVAKEGLEYLNKQGE